MIFIIEHIIREDDTIEYISECYNVLVDEIKELNPHITDFKNMPGGLKLRIPSISKNISQILDTTQICNIDCYKVFENMYDELENEKKFISKNNNDTKVNNNINKDNYNNFSKNRAYPGILPPNSRYNGIR